MGFAVPPFHEVVFEHRELAPVDLERLSVRGEREHQPLGAGALHMPCFDSGREHAEWQRLPAGLPSDGRTRQLELRDGPLLPRLAPQRKGDGPPAQRLAFALAGQHITELEIPQQRLRFGDEIVDRFMAGTNGCLNDDLGHGVLGRLGLGNRDWHLAFLLLRDFFRWRGR
jgi:hypothetical protein